MPNRIRWEYLPTATEQEVARLSHALFGRTDIPWQRTLTTLLLQRGISTFEQAKAFFSPSLEQLHDPFLMKDMDRAVERILLAIERGECILIYGDYDVDGTCAVSVLYKFLITQYTEVTTYVPDRYKEGYGVSTQGIDYAADNGLNLIITLDCGIKAHDKVLYAQSKGIEMIVADHHTPDADLPQAVAVLNPKRADCPYPYKELCGAGIAFKLVQALCKQLSLSSRTPYTLLDLVALATCADIVPMTGENRLLVHFGLRLINERPTPVMQALLASAKPPIRVSDLVFVGAPRINAAGRMAHANEAVAFLSEQDSSLELLSHAQSLEYLNGERKDTDTQITQEAISQIIENQEEDAFATVVFSPAWHKGVIGIVASRLIETYYRPTIVFTESGEVLAASARSVQGFDLYQALSQCKDYLLQFGGHKYAAGMTLKKENYLAFKKKFQEVVRQTLPQELRTPKITISGQLPLKDITGTFYHSLSRFAPFGPQNMTPIFEAKEVIAKEVRPIGADGKHLRMLLTDLSEQHTFVAIGFSLAHKKDIALSGKPFTIAYELTENHWQGQTSLQLVLKDIRC